MEQQKREVGEMNGEVKGRGGRKLAIKK